MTPAVLDPGQGTVPSSHPVTASPARPPAGWEVHGLLCVTEPVPPSLPAVLGVTVTTRCGWVPGAA